MAICVSRVWLAWRYEFPVCGSHGDMRFPCVARMAICVSRMWRDGRYRECDDLDRADSKKLRKEPTTITLKRLRYRPEHKGDERIRFCRVDPDMRWLRLVRAEQDAGQWENQLRLDSSVVRARARARAPVGVVSARVCTQLGQLEAIAALARLPEPGAAAAFAALQRCLKVRARGCRSAFPCAAAVRLMRT